MAPANFTPKHDLTYWKQYVLGHHTPKKPVPAAKKLFHVKEALMKDARKRAEALAAKATKQSKAITDTEPKVSDTNTTAPTAVPADVAEVSVTKERGHGITASAKPTVKYISLAAYTAMKRAQAVKAQSASTDGDKDEVSATMTTEKNLNKPAMKPISTANNDEKRASKANETEEREIEKSSAKPTTSPMKRQRETTIEDDVYSEPKNKKTKFEAIETKAPRPQQSSEVKAARESLPVPQKSAPSQQHSQMATSSGSAQKPLKPAKVIKEAAPKRVSTMTTAKSTGGSQTMTLVKATKEPAPQRVSTTTIAKSTGGSQTMKKEAGSATKFLTPAKATRPRSPQRSSASADSVSKKRARQETETEQPQSPNNKKQKKYTTPPVSPHFSALSESVSPTGVAEQKSRESSGGSGNSGKRMTECGPGSKGKDKTPQGKRGVARTTKAAPKKSSRRKEMDDFIV